MANRKCHIKVVCFLKQGIKQLISWTNMTSCLLICACVYIRKCKQKVAGQLGHVVELLLFAICLKCDSKPLQIFITLNHFCKPLVLHYSGYHCLYYYMRNFCNLIGLEQWYFSLICIEIGTDMRKLQNLSG